MYTYINVNEWDKVMNTEGTVAVWGNSPEYPEFIRDIVNEIINNGFAIRGDSIYSNADDAEEE